MCFPCTMCGSCTSGAEDADPRSCRSCGAKVNPTSIVCPECFTFLGLRKDPAPPSGREEAALED